MCELELLNKTLDLTYEALRTENSSHDLYPLSAILKGDIVRELNKEEKEISKKLQHLCVPKAKSLMHEVFNLCNEESWSDQSRFALMSILSIDISTFLLMSAFKFIKDCTEGDKAVENSIEVINRTLKLNCVPYKLTKISKIIT